MSAPLKVASGSSQRWTKDEDAILTAGIRSGYSQATMLEALPSRSVRAVQMRASTLGLKHPSSWIDARRPFRTEASHGTESQIIKLCSYIKSDSYIADYIGCSVKKVADLRRRVLPHKKTDEGYVGKGRPRSAVSETPIGMEADVLRRSAAVESSKALRDAMLRHYRAVALRKGISVERAMLACLYGRDAASRFITKETANG